MQLRFLSALLLLTSLTVSGQIKAVTENGDAVTLYSDGTWKMVTPITPGWDTRLDTPVVTKNAKNTFLVKGKKLKYGVWIDPKKWSFKNEYNAQMPAAEYFFSLKGGDVYAMTIPEGIEISDETLVSLALKSIQQLDPDAHLLREETRLVNNGIVKYVEFKATVSGIKFIYRGYYYTGHEGCVRFLAFTSENLLDKYKTTIDELLSGFTMKTD